MNMIEPLESILQCFLNHYWIKAGRRKSNAGFIANTFKKQFKITSKCVSVLPNAWSEDDLSPTRDIHLKVSGCSEAFTYLWNILDKAVSKDTMSPSTPCW